MYEFRPAPGQFTNELPEYEPGDTEETMRAKAEQQLAGRTDGMVSLGAWGGYITFGFDHPLVNVPGEYDLLVLGNAFINNQEQPDPEHFTLGSSEPGVVYVSRDENGDGLPNDTWYEIAGSEAAKSNRAYEVTYKNNGRSHITWTDNAGGSGVILRNQWHTQESYFPLWRKDEKTATYSGTLLPPNVYSDNNAYILPWGYVDNWPNDDERAQINLDWAVNEAGEQVTLPYVDFIRVMTGVMVTGTLTGEASTEVCGARDLHPDAKIELGVENTTHSEQKTRLLLVGGHVLVERAGSRYTMTGMRVR